MKINGGHRGARKLWRDYLPRLKYHNPTVSMVVNRTADQTAPSTLTLLYEQGTQKVIDMKNKTEPEIFKQLLTETGAVEVKATPEEEAEFKRIAAQEIVSEEHRRETRARIAAKLREEQFMAQARASVAASQQPAA